MYLLFDNKSTDCNNIHGSHRLKIETGRWSRTPREERLCQCGDIQDEHHVLLACPCSQHVRDEMDISYNKLSELMCEDTYTLCNFVYKTLDLYKWVTIWYMNKQCPCCILIYFMWSFYFSSQTFINYWERLHDIHWNIII